MVRPRATRQSLASTPAHATKKIPLNDDSAEKANRNKERSLQQSIQKERIRAAASPGGRRVTLGSDGSPKTPRNVNGRTVAGQGSADTVTPLRKVPILANFEEWMKLATDNKINAGNSWDFALIDYFHDMSLLKEGDSVNFQKASCTLDGCVKIYTSRVDSVATETGKLLSGLADSSTSRKQGRGRGEEEDEGAEGSDGEGDGEGEGRQKAKKKTQRSSEATLVKDFSQLQVKKLELEFSFDPLFKKASADFDEGGAKGLLLNHLSLDSNGRIVFDSSDDKEEGQEMEEIGDQGAEKPVEEEEVHEQPTEIANKLIGLRNKYFPDLSVLDSQHVCSSTKGLDLSTMEGIQDIPFLKALEDRNDNEDATTPENDDIGGNNDMAFGFDDGFGIGEGENMTMAFGEGGEAWANETIVDAADRLLSPSKRPPLGFQSSGKADLDPDDSIGFGPPGHSDILSYFDEALTTNWAGPEHWRIRRIKDNTKPANAPVRARKEKTAFLIDFMDPAADVPEGLLAPPKSEKTIELPKKDRVSKTRHLLPDDKHFNSRQLIRLFLKPKTSIIKRKQDGSADGEQNQQELDNVDEKFWAEENLASEIQASSTPLPKPNYDANFFNDDAMGLPAGLGDDEDDAELRGAFSPGPVGEGNVVGEVIPLSQIPSSQALDFGVHLVTQARRTRPEYVQYARVAKKVDVRKLKENLWNGLKFEGAPPPDRADSAQEDSPNPTPAPSEEPRKFTQLVNDLRTVYGEKTMADISTSYCFICLLHLANEKGLVVEEEGDALQELLIRVDPSAGEADAY